MGQIVNLRPIGNRPVAVVKEPDSPSEDRVQGDPRRPGIGVKIGARRGLVAELPGIGRSFATTRAVYLVTGASRE